MALRPRRRRSFFLGKAKLRRSLLANLAPAPEEAGAHRARGRSALCGAPWVVRSAHLGGGLAPKAFLLDALGLRCTAAHYSEGLHAAPTGIELVR